jgi:protein-tyrosine-phosphatase
VAVGRRHGLALGRLHPCHVDDVLADDDLVIAVCDNAHEQLATGEAARRRLHWSVPDPAVPDTDAAFEAAFGDIAARVDRLAPALAASGTSSSRGGEW